MGKVDGLTFASAYSTEIQDLDICDTGGKF